MTELMTDFGAFIEASPTSFHAAANLAERLRAAGYAEIDETQPFNAAPGGHFFVRDGACMAWYIPEGASIDSGFRVVGSHTDSPSFKLKPTPNHCSAGWQMLAMEIYGGPLLNSWLNRDMGLAGRLVTKDGKQHLVATGAIMTIPQLAPHLDRSVNDNLHLDKQANLMPVLTIGRPDTDVLDLLCEQANVERGQLGYYDIHATTLEKPATIGPNGEFFAAWRMDNLSSVFASVEALLSNPPTGDIAVLAAFDHEEVGSSTRSGAAGPILEDTLRGIAYALGGTEDQLRAMIARSSCISADAAHAVHPNYVHMHDWDTHPLFNQGPILKINSNQRYATDGAGGALWFRVCEAAGVPTQAFVGNNGVPCGSTIGPITATRLGIRTVDVGIPLLSMHSARELCGSDDMAYLVKVLAAYWQGI